MHTKAPIPTEQPLQPPTPAPVDTPAPTKPTTAIPSPIPTAPPTSEPTDSPTKNPTSEPTTAMPTQAPVPYDRNVVDLQPCSNTTVSIISGVSSSLLHFRSRAGQTKHASLNVRSNRSMHPSSHKMEAQACRSRTAQTDNSL